MEFDQEKLKALPTVEDLFRKEYGEKGTPAREEFEAKARAWYYSEILKDARKSAGMTQKELAERIGKKREYISKLERGETDMQLSTFLMISNVVGLKVSLSFA